MLETEGKTANDAPEAKQKRASRVAALPWPLVILTAVPVALSVYYLTQVAPARVASAKAVDTTWPAVTEFLGEICLWCGQNPWDVALIGLGVLVLGAILPLNRDRYFIAMTVLVSLFLGFTYYSISAPVERLIENVKQGLPSDRRVPDPLRKN